MASGLTPGVVPARVPVVSAALFESIAEYEGLVLPAHRIAESAMFYNALAPALARLREVSFPFLEDVPEPAAANRWIEEGGKSWQSLPI